MESGHKTRALFQRAQQGMPLGVTSNYRYWGDDKSLVIKKGEEALKEVKIQRLIIPGAILGHVVYAALGKMRGTMQDQVFVRMGDGERVLMPSDQVKPIINTVESGPGGDVCQGHC